MRWWLLAGIMVQDWESGSSLVVGSDHGTPTISPSHHDCTTDYRPSPDCGYRTPTKEQSHFGCLLPQPNLSQQADSRRVHFASPELRMSMMGTLQSVSARLEQKITEIVLSAINSLKSRSFEFWLKLNTDNLAEFQQMLRSFLKSCHWNWILFDMKSNNQKL